MNWLVPMSSLTQHQERAVELEPSDHRIILGGPGSGKTLVLLHRACYLRSKYHVPDQRFKIFVFTGVLKSYIKSAFGLLQLPESSVITFDKWCKDYFRENIRGAFPKSTGSNTVDFDALRQAVLQHTEQLSSQSPRYDFVLVDEGQDLDATAFRILKRIARHVTVCMDQKQQIYTNGSKPADVIQHLSIRTQNLYLLDAYRCCPYIAKLAAQFISSPDEREQYLRQVRTEQGERQTPLLYYVHDHADQMNRLIEIIKTRQQKGDSIGILFHQNKHVFGYSKGLREAGINVESPVNNPGDEFSPLDFNSDNPKIMTFHKAKGLTFDTVIMPQLTERNFYRLDSEQIERLLFVGITRATQWVYMSTNANGPLDSLAAILPLEAERCLTIQRPDVSVTGQPPLPFGISSETQVRPPDDLPEIETSPEDDLTDIL